jgi:hypothetical protein
VEPAVGQVKFGVESAASGERTLFFERGGKRRYLYSRYAPGRDGLRFRDEHPCRGCGLLVFIGLGIGHHIRPFLDDGGIGEIAVLEPSEDLFEAVRGTEEVRGLSVDPRVRIYTGPAVESFADGLAGRYDALIRGSIKVLSFSPLGSAFPSVYRALEERIRSRLELLVGDGVTIGRFARVWLGNFSSNMREAASCSPVSSLFGAAGGTAVVTGAGPSLDGMPAVLKTFRERFFLVSADASVKPLVRNGILPDLIVSVDPQPLVRFHLRGIDRVTLARVPAVLSLLSCPGVFGSFKKRYLFFTLHPSTGLFDTGYLSGEGAVLNYRSVGSYALKVALEMGFGTILLAGFDFSYPFLRVYAKDSFFHDAGIGRWDRYTPHSTVEAGVMAKNGTVRARAVEGETPVLTSRILQEYASEFEGVIGEAHACKARILRLGITGMHVDGVETVEDSKIEHLFRKVESMPHGIPLNMPKKGALAPDFGRWGTIRRDLILTLALRNRIFQGAQSGKEAMARAERSLARGAEKRMGLSQV